MRRLNYAKARVRSLFGPPPSEERSDIVRDHGVIVERCLPFTMTSAERLAANIDAVEYVTRAGVAGAVVECGVWKGGSAMAMALGLQRCGASRPLWLYDTYEGMSEPTDRDREFGADAGVTRKRWEAGSWCESPLDEVKANLASTGYADVRYIVGNVEATIPERAPDSIAVLRLDTDWYASTLHILEHLYPRLETGGVLLIDDYGYWAGCKEAVDRYFGAHLPFLSRSDFTGRVAVKP